MSDILDQLYARVDRADAHLRDLRRARDRFLGSKPYRFIIEQDPQTSEYVYRVEARRIPPPSMGLLAGEIVHQLQSCLDNLAHHVARTHGVIGDDLRRVAFPVCLTKEQWQSKKTKTRMKGFPDPLKDAIRDLQPYQRREHPTGHFWETAERHPLNRLDELWSSDKHPHRPLGVRDTEAL